MPDPLKPSRSLSEISHLFLSGVRERQTGGAALPRRRPPGSHGPYPAEASPPPADPAAELTVADLTAEEFALVLGEGPAGGGASSDDPAAPPDAADGNESPGPLGAPAEPAGRIPPVSAVIAAPLDGSPFERAREYARHLAAAGERVGLMEVDGSGFRLTCFGASPDASPHGGGCDDEPEPAADCFDAHAMTAAIDELSWDIDRWLVALPDPRTPEARRVLCETDHWVLLCTCDHDGVVACYRTLKGLADLRAAPRRPELSLAVLGAADQATAWKTHRKLAGVCEQFLKWTLSDEGPVLGASGAAEHPVMCCVPARDGARPADAPQWRAVGDFLARARARAARYQETPPPASGAAPAGKPGRAESPLKLAPAAPAPAGDSRRSPAPAFPSDRAASPMILTPDVTRAAPDATDAADATREEGARMFTPDLAAAEKPDTTRETTPDPAPGARPRAAGGKVMAEVIDLPDATESAILSAVLKREANELVECPLRPPMCGDARLAVTRDRRLVLLAVARQGLGDLRSIGLAFRWLVENRSLIGMAVPQLAVDAHQHPHLRLLVDHADLAADLLQPMLQSPTASLQAYRRLRWGEKTGLLLEAA